MRALTLHRGGSLLACSAVFLIALTASFVIEPPAHAQTTGKRATVGTLGVTSLDPGNQEMLQQGLAQLGYREGAVVLFSSPTVFYDRARIAKLAREKRLPTVALFMEFAEAGGLLSYGPSLRESFRRCGVYISKILNGTRPADLPIERPEKFELVINMRTAKALGLTIPQSFVRRADQVIE